MRATSFTRICVVSLGLTLLQALATGAPQKDTPGGEGVGAPCLTPELLEVNKKLLALDRPTKEGDPDWIFNPEYFTGTWTLEWEVPDSVLGAGGVLNGVLTFKHVDRCYYEGDLSVKGGDRPFTQKIKFLAD